MPLGYVELQFTRGLFECFECGLIAPHGIIVFLDILEILGKRLFGLLRSRYQVIIDILQRLYVVAVVRQGVDDRSRGIVVGREDDARVVVQQIDGFLFEKRFVLADHTVHVLTPSASVRTIAEQHLIGSVVQASHTLRLVEAVRVELGHVTLVEPTCDLTNAGVLPRGAAVLREVLVEDLLLDLVVVFGDLDGDSHRNLLPVEQLGQRVDQPRANISLRLPEFPDERFDGMPS